MKEEKEPLLTLLCIPVRHVAGRHRWRGRDEEGGAAREDGRQPT